MNYAHLLEALMLICFGFSWPLNVTKAYKARTAKGMSLPFIILIISGYIAGIWAKMMNGQFNYVLAVYFLNLGIVAVNLLVYFRNKSLDKKAGSAVKEVAALPVIKIEEEVQKEETMFNYTNSLDEYINRKPKHEEKKNGVILMGGSLDRSIPVSQLAAEFNFNFELYNKSEAGLSLSEAGNYFSKKIASLKPEGIIIHLGENDSLLARTNPSLFDTYYLSLIQTIKACNKACRIALVSVDNPENDKSIDAMNAHIKAIAQAEKASYISLENAKFWHPESVKAASNFAYSMGLNIRKPLNDVAEILYSWMYHNLAGKTADKMVG